MSPNFFLEYRLRMPGLAGFISWGKRVYRALYDTLCGVHPHVYPWHFQWLATRSIVSSIEAALRHVKAGKVLDVGCGTSPYRSTLPAGCEYIGIDVEGGSGKPDIIIQPDKTWPVADLSCDTILCTQVLEHVTDQTLLIDEIKRTLNPGGILILSVPFIYNEHGMPWDFRRFTIGGLTNLLDPDFEIIYQGRSCKAGTTVATLFLNWIDESMTVCSWLRYMKPLILPFWMLLSLVINVIGRGIDLLDRTNSFYLDCVYVGRRRA
jgi:SAM-dependent methyltransferase